MSIRNLQAPLTAAALAVLLAACGGGSGSSDSGGTGSSLAPKDASSTQTPGAAATAESASAAQQAQGAPIDSTGVRGDVLLSMLDHRTCHHKILKPASSYNGPLLSDAELGNTPNATGSVRLKDAPNYKLKPGQRPPPGMPGHDVPCTDSLYEYTPFDDGTSTLEQLSGLFLALRELPDPSKRPIRSIETSTPITVSGGNVTLGAEQSFQRFGDQLDQPQTLVSASAYTFQTSARIPYGLVTEWRQGADFNELMVLPGADETQAKLCWNTHTSFLRRLHCQVWELPDGWQRGATMNLEDQYIVDDRSMYPGESGHLFWRGNAEAPEAASQAAASVPAEVGTVPTADEVVTPGAALAVPAPATPAATPDAAAQPAQDAAAQPAPAPAAEAAAAEAG